MGVTAVRKVTAPGAEELLTALKNMHSNAHKTSRCEFFPSRNERGVCMADAGVLSMTIMWRFKIWGANLEQAMLDAVWLGCFLGTHLLGKQRPNDLLGVAVWMVGSR